MQMHPGEVLKDLMKDHAMSQKELAIRTGVSEKHICTIVNGDRSITPSFAKKLAYVFESDQYWINMQATYDMEQQSKKEQNSISDDEISILKRSSEIVSYFIERGLMHNACGDIDKVMQMRRLLQVSDLTVIPQIGYNAAYRAQLNSNVKVDPYILFAWQRLCEKLKEDISSGRPLDHALLEDSLSRIKSTMFSSSMEEGFADLAGILSECGIVFDVVKNFRGAPVQGFIKERPDGRILLCLTIRRQRADIFWFTLFHEIAHILNRDYMARFVDFESVQNATEEKADRFAADTLIDPAKYREFIHSVRIPSWSDIEAFAAQNEVQPFIVLGRLQKDEILDWSDHAQRVVKYKWS